GVRRADRSRALRDRERARAAAGARGQRVRVGRRAVSALAAGGGRGAGAGNDGARGARRRGGRPLRELRARRAASVRPGRHLLGARTAVRARMSVSVVNPATEETIAELPQAGVEETDEAVARARAAFPSWRAVPPSHRARTLRRLAGLVEEHAEELALLETRNVGKPIPDSRGEIWRVAEVFHVYAGTVDKP